MGRDGMSTGRGLDPKEAVLLLIGTIMALLLFSSCSSTKNVPISIITHDTLIINRFDTVYKSKLSKDSIHEIHDTIKIQDENGKTLETVVNNYYYHGEIKTDTIYRDNSISIENTKVQDSEIEIKDNKKGKVVDNVIVVFFLCFSLILFFFIKKKLG